MDEILFPLVNTPTQIFETKPSTSASNESLKSMKTIVYKFANLCEQGLHAESMIRLEQLNYVRTNVFRHFHMWRHVRAVYAVLKKVFPNDLKGWLTDVHRRLINAGQFELTQEAINYIQNRIFEQLTRLDITRRRSVIATNACLDYLDVGHWLSQSMVFIAIIAEIVASIRQAALSLISLYNLISSHQRSDKSFPTFINVQKYFAHLIEEMKVNKPSPLLKELMGITSNEVTKSTIKAETKIIVAKTANKIDIGVAISREEFRSTVEDSCRGNTAENQIKRKTKKAKKLKKKAPDVLESFNSNGKIKKKRKVKLQKSQT